MQIKRLDETLGKKCLLVGMLRRRGEQCNISTKFKMTGFFRRDDRSVNRPGFSKYASLLGAPAYILIRIFSSSRWDRMLVRRIHCSLLVCTQWLYACQEIVLVHLSNLILPSWIYFRKQLTWVALYINNEKKNILNSFSTFLLLRK